MVVVEEVVLVVVVVVVVGIGVALIGFSNSFVLQVGFSPIHSSKSNNAEFFILRLSSSVVILTVNSEMLLLELASI